MTDELSIPPERLVEETRWLRDLAERLVGPDAADDLAQSVWLRAFERPRAAVRQLRPWLRTVLKHMVIRRWRDDTARVRREVIAASPEATVSTAAVVERGSMCHALVGAVMALDEPWRTTILLRFFEGMRTQQIADLQRVPLATVRTRLQRALHLLRARLDGEYGGRGGWIAVTGPVFLGGKTAAVASGTAAAHGGGVVAGGMVMAGTTKVATVLACGVIICAGALWSVNRTAAALGTTSRPSAVLAAAAPSTEGPASTRAPSVVAVTPFAGEQGASAVAAGPWKVTGRVVDANEQPVGGVVVHLRVIAGADAAAAPIRVIVGEAGTDGAFAFGMLPPGDVRSFRATVSSPDYESGRADVTVGRGDLPPPPLVVHAYRYTSAFVGKVTDGVGKPVAGATVGWWDNVTSDANGGYRLPVSGWRPRTHVVCSALGYAPAVVDPACPPAGHDVCLNFALAPEGIIEGVVQRHDGSPVVGARVQASIVARPAETTTDDKGHYQLGGFAAGDTYGYIAASAPGLILNRGWPKWVGRRARVDLTLESGVRVIGVVVANDGRPIKDAWVNLGEYASADQSWVKSGWDGRFSFDAVPPRTTVVRVSAERFGPLHQPIEILPDGPPLDLRLVLGPGHHLAGRVVDSKGAPIPRVSINTGHDSSDSASTKADADGVFLFEGLPDVCQVTFYSDRFVPQVVEVKGDRDDLVVQLKAKTAVVALQVVDAATNAPVTRFTFTPVVATAERTDKQAFHGISHEGGPGRAVEAVDGKFNIEEDESEIGSVIGIEVRADGYAPGALPRVVIASTADAVVNRVALTRGATVTGVVVTPRGDPIARAAVCFLSTVQRDRMTCSPWRPTRDTETGNDGGFSVKDVAPGITHVWVTAENVPSFCAGPFTVLAGQPLSDLRIVMPDRCTITGLVLDPAGRPVAGARVYIRAVYAIPGFRETYVGGGTDGRFSAGDLPAGTFMVGYVMDAGDMNPAISRWVEVASGETQDVRLAFDAPCTLRLTLVGADPMPAKGFMVSVDPKAAGRKSVSSGPQITRMIDALRGTTIDITGLEPGRHNVWVRGRESGGGSAPVLEGSAEVVLTPGVTAVTITLRPG